VRHLAHELRQPLSTIESITFYLQMALATQDPKVREQLGRLGRTVEQASWILADAVHYLQATPLRLQTVYLDEVITASLAECDGEFDMSMEIREAGIAVRMDLEQARHLVRTLINVAARMTRHGNRVHVAARRDPGWAVLEVHVNDVQYGNHQLQEMFQPFAPHLPAGSGLALASAQRIAEQHRGMLEARSSPNTGTRLLARFPLAE
jgi:signal transduction histidine kinase